MTGKPRTHHFIIVYFADRPEKDVDINYGRPVSYYCEWKEQQEQVSFFQ